MSSAVSGPGSVDPLTLVDSLTPPARSVTSAVQTSSVSAKQEPAAIQTGGRLDSLLSDAIAVGLLQITNPASSSPAAATDLTSLANQLVSAYANPAESPAISTSAETLPMNPALAIIQEMERASVTGPALADSVGG